MLKERIESQIGKITQIELDNALNYLSKFIEESEEVFNYDFVSYDILTNYILNSRREN